MKVLTLKKYFALIGSLFLVACNSGLLGSSSATQDSISLTTTAGNCPDGMTNAPYCMAITINNNAGGQNYINSTNYPISSISVATNGANNVISPMNNAITMDPNRCTSATIQPGSNCTFYVEITSEAYKVSTHQPINVAINYTVNDSLFVNGDHKGSNNLTIYENTNLYILNNTGYLWTYNYDNQGISTPVLAESVAGTVLSSTIDTAKTGKLILSNSSNIWSYGLGNVSSSITSSSGIVGARVMFVNSSGLYASSAVTGTFYNAVESYGSFAWTNKSTPSSVLNLNACALTPATGLYVAQGNQTLNCSGIFSSTTTTCATEAIALPSNINALAYSGILYAGTSGSSGVYYESGTGTAATWNQVANLTSGAINMMKTANNGYVIVADDANNLWSIASGSPSATNVASGLPASVNAFAIDNFASVPNVYFVANNNLWSCGSGGFMSCTPTLLATGISGTALNLLIGSSLSAN